MFRKLKTIRYGKFGLFIKFTLNDEDYKKLESLGSIPFWLNNSQMLCKDNVVCIQDIKSYDNSTRERHLLDAEKLAEEFVLALRAI
jgi:hypothetical protein